MNPILRNVLAVIAGIIIGGVVNMGIIIISGSVIPLPQGVDNTTVEGLKASAHLMGPQHYIFPFIAHAGGTLVGAFGAAKIAVTQKTNLALLVGGFFLIGGIMMVMQVPSPMWFNILDIIGAYIPMGYLGGRLATS